VTPGDLGISGPRWALLDALLRERGLAAGAARAIPRRSGGPAPLSFGQERLWFLHQLDPLDTSYHLASAARFRGLLDVTVLAQALTEIVRRHEVLRTTFAAGDGGPVQVVGPAGPVELPLTDLGYLPESGREAEARRRVTEAVRRPFDLARGPLLRVHVLRLDDRDHVLLMVCHHVVADGWSFGIFVRELSVLYQAYRTGRPSSLPEPSIQYADYAAWQRKWLEGDVLERQTAYWKRQLAGLPPLHLPTDRARPTVPSSAGAIHHFSLSRGLTDRVAEVARGEGATPYMVLLAAFQTLLGRYSGQTDFAVGTPAAGRTRAEVEGLIGFFVNTLVARADLAGNPSFRELLARTRRAALAALDHQELPFERLVAQLQPDRDPARHPLVQVLFAFQNVPAEAAPFAELVASDFEVDPGGTAFDLTLSMGETAEGLVGELAYRTDLFDAGIVARLAGHYQTLLAAAVTHPDRRIGALPLLTEAERRQVLLEWNPTPDEPADARCIHELFEEQAARRPDAEAVAGDQERLTYGELDRRADRLASVLRAAEVGLEVRVGVCLERSPELVVAILAVLKAGGAYVPLDPEYPRERLALLLADARPAVLLTCRRLAGRLPESAARVVCLDDEGRPPGPRLPGRATLDNLAYVIYTSGSTGRPKGVLVRHRSLVHSTLARLRYYREPIGKFLLLSSSAFDSSVAGIFGTLCSGGTLVLPPHGAERDPREVAGRVAAERVTHVLYLPSVHALVLEEGRPERLASLRAVIVAGEACPADLVGRHLQALPHARLFNEYGPTEGTVWSTVHECGLADAAGPVPIGRPAPHARVYLVDRFGNPVPVGVPGEVYVGGAGVAEGYLGAADLTAERFVPDPFGARPGGRLYRTGDLARYRLDGTIEFLGRADQQVKVRGHRVEPGEIEAALAGHPGVRDAAVLARVDTPGDRRLVAHVVPREGAALAAAELREFLRARLPAHLLPDAVVLLAALPRTPNGKLDRQALPPPDWQPPLGPVPRSPAEEVVAGIWREVLGVRTVSRDDDFFDLGGHSLLAARVMARVRDAFEADLPLRALFDAPTVAGLAVAAEAARRGGEGLPPLRPVPRTGNVPLSYAQQRLWFFEQFQPETSVYTQATAVRLSGELDVEALRRTLSEIVARHEVLRTTFAVVAGEAIQVIGPPADLPLPVTDLGHLPDDEREAEVLARAAAETARGFDLERGPLLRLGLLRLGAREHVLLFACHHIVSDGWSIGVFLSELSALYPAFRAGLPSPLPALPVQYADYAAWQRAWLQDEVFDRQLAYWRNQLADLPILAVPTDRPRPAVQSFRGATLTFDLPADLSEALAALSRREGVTLFMTLMAAFQALLTRHSGQRDFGVGTPTAGRTRAETEGLIGFFVNTLVIRADLSGDPTFRELLGRVRRAALGAFDHQDLPFERLVADLRLQRDPGRSPLFQVMFALQNVPAAGLDLPGLEVNRLDTEEVATAFDLSLDLRETDDGLAGRCEYSTDLFDAVTVARLLGHYQRLLASAVADPERRVVDLHLLTEGEAERLLAGAHGPRADSPVDRCLHELIEEQARRAPDAVAVECGPDRLMYADLDRWADRLADALRRLGVGPEVCVGICVERSAEFIVGLLAVLKAGGAFVPLDPAYPRERLGMVLGDARAAVVLTRTGLADRLPAGDARVLCLDRVPEWQGPIVPHRRVTGNNLAYVIYTSGSSGRPKGVAVPHAEAVAHLVTFTQAYHFGPTDRVLQFASLTFDTSLEDIFPALLSGATLVMRGPDLWSPAELLERVAQLGITVMNLPTAYWHELARELNDPAAGRVLAAQLRYVEVTGEAVLPDAVARWQRSGLGTVRLVNSYGPTEATVTATVYDIPPREEDSPVSSIPIGRPLMNRTAYVLDERGRLAPLGVAGELYLGGAGLARGYLGRPDLTAERFVPDPFGPPGARLYRTGDRARWLAEGELEFLGRLDQQVKVRGFRVEPGDVEAALATHISVRQVAVLAREDTPGLTRLTAYVVRASGAEVTAETLRDFLRDRLPDYLRPAAYVFLDTLPLTPHGKLDRRALPPPAVEPAAPPVPLAPLEEMLAGIWCEVLGIPAVGPDDNFFDQGGHSLLAVRFLSGVRAALGADVPLAAFFQGPTLRQLARAVTYGTRPRPTPLLLLRSGESGPPLFCVHPLGGTVLCYFDLARRLGPGRPVFGVRAPELDADRDVPERIEDMAAGYITAVREIQPDGPYLLAGWSMGAAVAFEMARQLTRAGAAVACVAILDMSARYAALFADDDTTLLSDVADDLGIPVSEDTLRRLEPDDQLEYVVRQAAGPTDTDLVRRTVRRYWQVCKGHERALQAYRPGRYAGRVTILRSVAGPSGPGGDRTMGWGDLAEGGAEVFELPGTHQTLLNEPCVSEVARALQACIDRGLGGQHSSATPLVPASGESDCVDCQGANDGSGRC
jgi:amino acid adenylation domain-containing protein